MKNIFQGYFLPILAILFQLLYSCTPESCFEETEAFLKASFYNNDTKQLQAPDSLTIFGLNMELFKVYNKSLKIQTALLPLNPGTDNCKFIIKINGISDTVELVYYSFPHLVSKECGYTFYHNIEQPVSTNNIIKYIYLNNSSITTNNEENIRIFY